MGIELKGYRTNVVVLARSQSVVPYFRGIVAIDAVVRKMLKLNQKGKLANE